MISKNISYVVFGVIFIVVFVIFSIRFPWIVKKELSPISPGQVDQVGLYLPCEFWGSNLKVIYCSIWQ